MVKNENAEEGIFLEEISNYLLFFVNWNIDKHLSRSKQMNSHLTCVLLAAPARADWSQNLLNF